MRSLARPLAQYPEWWALLAFEALFWLARPLLTDHSLEWLVAFGGLGFLMLSGAALVILLGDDGNWWERLSLAFVASVSLPSLVAQIFMLAHTSIQAYAVAYLALMLVLVAAALLRIARHTRAGTTIHTHVPAEGRTPRLLILFLAIALLGHYVFWTRSPLNSDEWNALSWIQNIRYDQHMMTDEPLYGQQFGVTARYEFVPWLAQQAMISYAVGMDPVDLLVWIRLPLFLLSLSAVYRFARAITRRREAAALGTLAWSLYLFYWINGNYPGYELSVRADLDKILSGFMLLPIVLGLTMRALQSGGVRSWLWLLLGAIAGGLMHPLAMGLIGLCLVGMGSLDVIGLLDNPRSSRGRGGQTRRVLRNPSGLAGLWRAVATRVGVNQWRVVQRLLIAALILAVGLIPSLAALTDLSENPLGAALSSVSATSGAIHDPSLARNLNFALVLRRLWILDTGQYIINPEILLQPFHFIGLLALIPLLIWLWRERGVRMMLGIMIICPLVLVIPPTAQLMGRLVTPWLLYRLAWPVPIVSATAIGWTLCLALDALPRVRVFTAEGAERAEKLTANLRALRVLGGESIARSAAQFVVVALVTVFALPEIAANLVFITEQKDGLGTNMCIYTLPLLRPFLTLTSPAWPSQAGRDKSWTGVTVLAEDDINNCLSSFAPYANIMEFRWTNLIRYYPQDEWPIGWQRLFDTAYYAQAEMVDTRLMDILDRWEAGFLIVRRDSPLDTQVRHLPALFQPVTSAINRTVYRVQHPEPVEGRPPSAIVEANNALHLDRLDGPDGAIARYQALLNDADDDTRFLATLGLGKAYLNAGRLGDAIAAFQQATAINQGEGLPWDLLAEAYVTAGGDRTAAAREAFQQAVARDPDNGSYQQRLGDLCAQTGDLDCADAAYRASMNNGVVPRESSLYYDQLGHLWAQANVMDRSISAYQKGIGIYNNYIFWGDLGQAYEKIQRWDDAEQAMRQIQRLSPWEESGHSLLAALYLARNQFRLAETEYRIAITLNIIPTYSSYAPLGEIVRAQQGADAAIAQLKKLVAVKMGVGAALTALATLEAEGGQADQATAHAAGALDWYGLDPASYLLLASLHSARGELDEAESNERQVLELNSHDINALSGLALIASRRGQLGLTKGYDLRAVQANPYASSPSQSLAKFYEGRGDLGLVLDRYETAARIDPSSSGPLLDLGGYYQRQGDLTRARELYQQAEAILPNADVYSSLAQLDALQGQMSSAIANFRKVVALNPGLGSGHDDLGGAYQQIGDGQSAIREYQTAIRVDPGDANAPQALAAAYDQLGRFDEARSAYLAALRALPDDDQAYLGLAQLAEAQGDPEQAAALYQQALKTRPPTASPRCAWGDFLKRQGKAQAAADAYRDAISQEPAFGCGYVSLSQWFLDQGGQENIVAAAEVLAPGLRLSPTAADLNQALANVQLAQGRPADALKTYQDALVSTPSAASLNIGLANLQAATGQPAQALSTIAQAALLWPGSSSLLSSAASFQIALGEPQQALSTTLQLVALAPGEASSWDALGGAHAALAQFDQALEAYTQATVVEPGNSTVWLALGQFLDQRVLSLSKEPGRDESAVRSVAALQLAIQLNQSQPGARLTLGDLLNRQGKTQDALTQYQIAASLDRTQDAAALAIGQIHQQLAQLTEARRDFDEAIAAAPADPTAYQAKAGLFLQQGETASARAAFLTAIQMAPGNCQSYQNLAKFQTTRGEWEDAIARYRTALALVGCEASAHIGIGDVLSNQAKPAEALVEYQQAIRASPGDVLGTIALADTELSQYRWDEAMAAYALAAKHVPASDLLNTSRGSSLMVQGRLAEAVEAAQQAVALRPSNAFNYTSLGRAYQTLGQYPDAERAYQKGAAINLSLSDPQLSLGGLYQLLGQGADAQSAYRLAIRINPSDPRGYNGLAALSETQAKPDEAIALYQQGADADHSQIGSLLALGDLYRALARPDDADTTYRQALAVAAATTTSHTDPTQIQQGVTAPAATQVYVALGDLRLSQADWKAAEALYRQATQAGPSDPTGAIRLGQTYETRGQPQEALAQFVSALQVAPISAAAYGAQGDLYRGRADWAAADAAYRSAMKVAPADTTGYLGFSQLYLLQSKTVEAAAQIEAAIKAAPSSPDAPLAFGNLRMSQADFTAANEAYQRAVSIAPGNPSVYVSLGQAYQTQGRWNDARAQFASAIALSPASAAALDALGDWQRLQANFIGAEEAYRQAIKVAPADPNAYISLGQQVQTQAQPSQALALFREAVRVAPASSSAYLAIGGLQLSQADPASAEQAYRQAIALAPSDPNGPIHLGQLYQLQGAAANALTQFNAAIASAPGSAPAYTALGDFYRSQGNWRDAEGAYRQAIAVAANDPSGLIGLGDTFQAQARFDEAQAQYRAATQAAPASASAYNALGGWYNAQADYASAQQTYQRAIDVAPTDPTALVARGKTFEAQGLASAALAHFDAAIKAAPSSTAGPLALGDYHSLHANVTAAETAYHQAIALSAADPTGYISLGGLFELEGKPDAALTQYQTAIAVAPASVAAWEAVGNFYRQQADGVNAEQAYQRAASVAPSSPNGLLDLGQLYQGQAQPTKALAQFEAATRAAPASGQAWVDKGNLYKSQANWVEAAKAYQQAIAIAPTDPDGYTGLGQLFTIADCALLNALSLEGRGVGVRVCSPQAQFEAAVKAAPASVSALVALGNWYVSQGNWPAAEQAFLKAIRIQATDPNGYLSLAQVYEDQGIDMLAHACKPPACLPLQIYEAAVKAAPSSAQAQAALGDWYRQQADFASAKQSYQRAIEVARNDPSGYLGLAQTYQQEGAVSLPPIQVGGLSNGDAQSQYDAAIKAAPASASALDALAGLLRLQANWITATQIYSKAIQVAPADPTAYIALGQLYQNQGSGTLSLSNGSLSQGAADLFEAAVTVAPASASAIVARGNWRQSRAQPVEAIADFQQAVAVDPTSQDAFSALVGALKLQGSLTQTLATAQMAVSKNPGSAWAEDLLGDIYTSLAQPANALAAYQRAATKVPGDVDALVALGRAYELRGLQAQAMAAFQQAVALQPGNPGAHDALAGGYFVAGQSADALSEYQAAINVNHTSIAAYLALGDFYAARSQLDLAIQTYQQALAADAANVSAMLAIGNILQREGKTADALAQFQKAALMNPGVSTPLDSQANLYRDALKDYSQSTASFQQALGLQPGDVSAYVGLALTLQAAGKYDEALQPLTTTLSLWPGAASALATKASLLVQNFGQYTDALTLSDQAVQLDARQTSAYQTTVQIHRRTLRDLDTFIAQEDALRLANPGTAAYPGYLAYAYGAKSDLTNAISSFESLLGLVPDYGGAHCALADDYRRTLDRQKAIREYGLCALLTPASQTGATATGQEVQLLNVMITAPANGETVSGLITITGSASAFNFQFYKVEYAADADLETWTSIAVTSTTAVIDGALTAWDTTILSNGKYDLRLTVVDKTGNILAIDRIQVTVGNAPLPPPEGGVKE